MGAWFDKDELIRATALSSMLQDTLERMNPPLASDDFIAGLREFCEVARLELGLLQKLRAADASGPTDDADLP